MKRLSSILAFIAVLFLCGCSKISFAPEENLASISISVSMDGGLTKAAADGDGTAAKVNRCILQIWEGNSLFKTVVRTAPAGTKEYSFKGVTLNPDATYDFLFWADCGNSEGGDLYYSTESLKNVRMLRPDKGNDDAADAFCNRILGCTIDTEYTASLVLRRPLAQLNFIAKDMNAVAELPLTREFTPVSVSYGFSGCTGFDVREGKSVGDPIHISVENAPIYGNTSANGLCTLAMTYIFPQSGKSVSAVDIKVKSANDAVMASYRDNVPFQENYRTNVSGNLMTVSGDFSVSLSPMFGGEIDK